MQYYTELLIFMPILLILLVLVFFLSWRSHKRLVKKTKQLTQQWAMQNEYMDSMEAFSLEAKEVTCEVRAMLAQVRSIQQETGTSCLESCDAMLAKTRTGNAIADALLYSKETACKNQGISFHAEIHALPDDTFPEMALTALLGNLLDNAIEAAAQSNSKTPYVRLFSQIKRNVWLVNVENSKEPTSMPIKSGMRTTKDNAESHGLGLQILNQIIEDYDGDMKLQDEENRFLIKFSLIL